MPTIKTVIVDDHEIIRASLRLVLQLQPDIEIVGEAEDVDQAIAVCETAGPDVVLLNIDVTPPALHEFVGQLQASNPNRAVLVMSSDESEPFVFGMLGAGAAGYLPLRASPVELVGAVRSVSLGSAYVYAAILRTLAGASRELPLD